MYYHLKSINLHQSKPEEGSKNFRQDGTRLESSNFEYLYSHYYKVVSVSYGQWVKDLRENTLDAERLLLPAISNVMQVLILTDNVSFPVIRVIPTPQKVLLPAECVIFVESSNQLRRFYGLVPEKKEEKLQASSDVLQLKASDVACRCRQGRNRG